MKTLTKESLALKLNNCQIDQEISKADEQEAKKNNLVIVFGASDDLIEFRGAINDEQGASAGHISYIYEYAKGFKLIDFCETLDCNNCFLANEILPQILAQSIKIKALWDKEGYAWSYEVDFPHSTFDVLEGSDKYCKGIVFDLDEVQECGVR